MELIGGQGTTVGVVRRVSFADGRRLDELLTCLDDEATSIEYALVGHIPWPVRDVRGLIRLHGLTATDFTMVEWRVRFETSLPHEQANDLSAAFARRLAVNLETLRRIFD